MPSTIQLTLSCGHVSGASSLIPGIHQCIKYDKVVYSQQETTKQTHEHRFISSLAQESWALSEGRITCLGSAAIRFGSALCMKAFQRQKHANKRPE